MATKRLIQLPPIEAQTVDGHCPASLLRLDAEFKAGHTVVLVKPLHDSGHGIREIAGRDDLPVDLDKSATIWHASISSYHLR
jgi:hypothetical protein